MLIQIDHIHNSSVDYNYIPLFVPCLLCIFLVNTTTVMNTKPTTAMTPTANAAPTDPNRANRLWVEFRFGCNILLRLLLTCVNTV